jgi:uracil phosphoribosyltransferase
MNTIVLSEQFSLVNSWINELRNVEIQHDRMRFRRNMERIGEIAAFEISKTLEQKEIEIQTPLDTIKVKGNCCSACYYNHFESRSSFV